MIDLNEEYKIHETISKQFMDRFGEAFFNVIGYPEKIKRMIRYEELNNPEIQNLKTKHVKIGPQTFPGFKGEKYIKYLEKKIKNKIQITDEEIIKLIHIGYSKYKTNVACLYKKAAKIIRNIDGLNSEEIESIEYQMCMIYGRTCSFKDYENMKNILKIGYPIYEKGMKALETKIAISLLNQNAPIDLIHQRAKLPIEYIEKLAIEN